MFDIRLTFTKTGSAAYMSHLDLMRALQRSICRAALPARYSLGFNPHIVLSILSPLSTGFQGLSELCDFSLNGPMDFGEIAERLTAAMPDGMRAVKAQEPVKKAAHISWSDFEIVYPCGEPGRMNELFSAPVVMEKRSKRGSKPVDLRDYMMGITFSKQGEKVSCRAVLRADTDPLNPGYITAALVENGLIDTDFAPSYIRHAILDENTQIFY